MDVERMGARGVQTPPLLVLVNQSLRLHDPIGCLCLQESLLSVDKTINLCLCHPIDLCLCDER